MTTNGMVAITLAVAILVAAVAVILYVMISRDRRWTML